jgi:uncharacterized low-complexity protein
LHKVFIGEFSIIKNIDEDKAMKKLNRTPLATAMGTMVISGFTAHVNADANPFALNELSNGYMQVAVDLNNKVSEAGCGSNTNDKKPNPHAAHAAGQVKKAEGACGEGKCGGMMSGGKMKAGMESSCGAMMKNKEGACGMGMMGGMNHSAADAKSAEHVCGAMMKGQEGGCGAAMSGHKSGH